jgi:hypothetical protein
MPALFFVTVSNENLELQRKKGGFAVKAPERPEKGHCRLR